MAVDDRSLLDDGGRETVLSRQRGNRGVIREAAVARKCQAPQGDHATHKAHHLKTDGYPANFRGGKYLRNFPATCRQRGTARRTSELAGNLDTAPSSAGAAT